jgi:non-ribosomal peptide synthetase component E (peptide arylation enzyme)
MSTSEIDPRSNFLAITALSLLCHAADAELRGVDAAFVGTGRGASWPPAVVVSRTSLTLAEVPAYLDGIAMTETYQPTRLEVVEQMPRNAMGKVDKHHLRTWLRGSQSS